MNSRLKERIQAGIRGGLPLTDSHKAIHQDSLTRILRLEAEVALLEGFLEFVRGYLADQDYGIAGHDRDALLKRVWNVDADLKGGSHDR